MLTLLRHKIGLVILSFFLFLCILEAGMRLGGLCFSSLQELRNQLALRQKDAIRIMCIGESTTAMGDEHSYPAQLERILNERMPDKKFQVINRGIVSANSTLLADRLERDIGTYQPDILIAMIGINDQNRLIVPQAAGRWPWLSFLRSLRVYRLSFYVKEHITAKIAAIFPDRKRKTALASMPVHNASASVSTPITSKQTSCIDNCTLYIDVFECRKAEECFQQSCTNMQSDIVPFLGKLGRCFQYVREYDRAEFYLKKAIELDPKSSFSYHELGRCFRAAKKQREEETFFKNAIASNPDNIAAYVELGRCYKTTKRYPLCIEYLEKAISMNPSIGWYYAELQQCYQGIGMLGKAKETLKKAIELEHDKDRNSFRLGALYKAEGQNELAQQYFIQGVAIQANTDNFRTRQAYEKIRAIAKQKEVRLVCVEYPMRPLELLRRLFDSTEGIIFVDNESIFKEAVDKGCPYEYFTDRFAGDFGHCTPKGNHLLADNIAQVLIREIFKK